MGRVDTTYTITYNAVSALFTITYSAIYNAITLSGSTLVIQDYTFDPNLLNLCDYHGCTTISWAKNTNLGTVSKADFITKLYALVPVGVLGISGASGINVASSSGAYTVSPDTTVLANLS